MRVYDDTIVVAYNQAYVMAGGDWPDLQDTFAGQANGLCGAAIEGTLWLMTASNDGPVRFIVEVLASEPAIDESYEDIVEVSFKPRVSHAGMTGLMGGPGGCEFELSHDSYRVRYSGKNVDAAITAEEEAEDDRPDRVDEYLVQFWPAAYGSDVVVRRSSRWAMYRHELIDGTAARREAENDNPLRDAAPRTRHAALVWLVERAGVRNGIDRDSLFVGALSDSWMVLDEFESSGEDVGNLFAFMVVPTSAWNQSRNRLRQAVSRSHDEAVQVPQANLLDNPIWHRLKAWVAADALLSSPMAHWDDTMQAL